MLIWINALKHRKLWRCPSHQRWPIDHGHLSGTSTNIILFAKLTNRCFLSDFEPRASTWKRHMRGSREGWGTWEPDPLKKLKVTQPAFDVESSSVSQLNAIYTAFCWRTDGGPLCLHGFVFYFIKTLDLDPIVGTVWIRAWKTNPRWILGIFASPLRSLRKEERSGLSTFDLRRWILDNTPHLNSFCDW